MKFLIVVGVILTAYFVWRFVIRGDAVVLMLPDAGKRVTATVKRVIPDKGIVIEVDNNAKENRVTEISLLRSLASELGVSAPSGFTEEPLPLAEKEKNDKDAVEFVEKFNREKLRWVGNFPLAPNAKTDMVIPAKTATKLSGCIDFRYEAKLGLGGFISSFSVDIASQDTNKSLKSTNPAQGDR
jgi:hypothetical protein